MTKTFRRPALSRFVGVLMYCLIVPVLGVFVATGLAALTLTTLQAVGVPESKALMAACVWLPVVLIGLTIFAVRDYRRRAAVEVTIGNDCISIDTERQLETIRFAEVKTIRIVPKVGDYACVILQDDGRRCQLPVDIAPLSVVRNTLEETLLPILAQRVADALASDDSVHVLENRLVAYCRIPFGVFLMILSVLLVISIRFFGEGVHAFVVGKTRVREGWRGTGGGFIVDQTGLRKPPALIAETRWDQVHEIRHDKDGIVIHSSFGVAYTASTYAENFWPVAYWLEHRNFVSDDSHRQE